jgi:hypothetical protein
VDMITSSPANELGTDEYTTHRPRADMPSIEAAQRLVARTGRLHSDILWKFNNPQKLGL